MRLPALLEPDGPVSWHPALRDTCVGGGKSPALSSVGSRLLRVHVFHRVVARVRCAVATTAGLACTGDVATGEKAKLARRGLVRCGRRAESSMKVPPPSSPLDTFLRRQNEAFSHSSQSGLARPRQSQPRCDACRVREAFRKKAAAHGRGRWRGHSKEVTSIDDHAGRRPAPTQVRCRE